MPHQPDYSDSDDESIHEELETGVLLGLPDGAVTSKTDLFDPAVSRMGGLPCGVHLSKAPWTGCSTFGDARGRGVNERTEGKLIYLSSVRAYRSVKFNARFAAKLERQKQKTKEKEEAKRRAAEEEPKKKASAAPASSTVKPNPFS
ncbi:hypothetical protein FRC01_010151, partial [Tulasnella sp. 417]